MLVLARAALVLTAGTTLFAQTYEIHFDRPASVGQTYDLSGDGSLQETASFRNQVVRSKGLQVSLHARAKVQEISKKGLPLRVELTIVQLNKTEDGQTSELLKSGTVVIADSREKEKFTLRHDGLDEATQEALGIVYDVDDEESTTVGRLVGADKPRTVGESWPIDATRAAEDLGKAVEFAVRPEQLDGKVTFVGIDKLNSLDCAHVQGQVSVNDLAGFHPEPDATIKSGNIESTFGGCYPLRASAQSFTESFTVSSKVQIVGPNGMQGEATMEQKSNKKWLAPDETQ